jgi:cytochrome c oxidase subunit I
MIQAKHQIAALFFIVAVAMVATALVISESSPAVDLYIHDTYYVISHTAVFFVLSLYFVACGIIYLVYGKVLRKAMSPRLGHVHFWLSVLAVAILLHSFYEVRPSFLGNDVPRAQAAMHSFAEFGFVAFFGFFVAQVVFVVNIFWSFFRRA